MVRSLTDTQDVSILADIGRLFDCKRAIVLSGIDDPLVGLLKFIRNTNVLRRLATDEKNRGPTTTEVLASFPMFSGKLHTLHRLLRYDPNPIHPENSIVSMADLSMEWTTTPAGDELIRRAEAGETEFVI